MIEWQDMYKLKYGTAENKRTLCTSFIIIMRGGYADYGLCSKLISGYFCLFSGASLPNN